jgi:hypothetical protein
MLLIATFFPVPVTLDPAVPVTLELIGCEETFLIIRYVIPAITMSDPVQ